MNTVIACCCFLALGLLQVTTVLAVEVVEAQPKQLALKKDKDKESAIVLDHAFVPLNQADKTPINLAKAYTGKVLLIVNTASKCGFTSQYEALEAIYQKYKSKGLLVLGFPSNDFFQERAENDKIAEFCRLNYGVTFPVFEKTSVRGKKANALYQQLNTASDSQPKWNFYKYLLDREGKIVSLFPSTTKPDSSKMIEAIESLL